MSEFYSRIASASLIKEVTPNTPLTPTTFFHFLEEDITTEYAYTQAMPVSSNRALALRAVKNKIPAPNGTITLQIEPKTWGHFLRGIFGGITSGRYLPISSESAAFTVGETVTGGSSGATGVVVIDSNGEFLLISGGSGTFTAGETITGGTSASTATVTTYAATVYGHVGTLPVTGATVLPTYTLQINYAESAIRYMGVRFTSLDALAQQDNIITAGVKIKAMGQFRHAKVTAVTTSGSTKTITVDQTYGLVDADVIKIYRPGTGFLDVNGSGVKFEAITSVTSTTTFTLATLTTSTAVGDLVMLAPQTASYTIGSEFPWIGGSYGQIGDAIASLATEALEDFTLVVDNEFEERHSAAGNLFKDQFPTALLMKGLQASGTFKAYYNDEDFMRLLRTHTAQALRIKTLGALITGTLYNEIRFTFPEVQFDPYETNITTDDIVNEEVPFTSFYNTTVGYSVRAALINDVASY